MESIKRELRVIRNNNGSPALQRIIKWAIFLGFARKLRDTRWFRAWAFGLPITGRRAYVLQAQDRCMDETLGRLQGRPGLEDGLAFSLTKYPKRGARFGGALTLWTGAMRYSRTSRMPHSRKLLD